jgi:hypothetical protein
MMERMIARAEQLAHGAQQRRLQQVATQLRAMFSSTAIEVEEARVLVRGRGIVKRWLIDPSLRFLAGGLK